jgi:hypothetical protein
MANAPSSRIAAAQDWRGLNRKFVPPVAPDPGAAPAPRPKRWPPTRVAAVETLWGAGFNGPVGPAETLRLVTPLKLNADTKLLLMGGGPGGPACAIAGESGTWITNFEADGELAVLARERVGAHRCAERIIVQAWNPQNPDFGLRASDHALLVEALAGADPVPALDSLASSLRPRSQIVMTEMVMDQAAPVGDREFAAWCRLENRQTCLPRGDDITAALTRLRYDVRVVEDISAAHVSAALAGWRNAVKTMGEGPAPSPAAASVVVTEAELWLLRIRVMRRFGFRLLRWHAIGTARNGALA